LQQSGDCTKEKRVKNADHSPNSSGGGVANVVSECNRKTCLKALAIDYPKKNSNAWLEEAQAAKRGKKTLFKTGH